MNILSRLFCLVADSRDSVTPILNHQHGVVQKSVNKNSWKDISIKLKKIIQAMYLGVLNLFLQFFYVWRKKKHF